MCEKRGAKDAEGRPTRVLIAEDDAASRRRLELVLGGWGYEVLTASDGREALDLFRRFRPEVCLLDWLMPELDGVEVCREIRSAPAGEAAQVILVSSRAERSDVVEALEAGADGHLAKPWGNAELRAHLSVAERTLRRQAGPEDTPGAGASERLPGELLGMCSYCRKVCAPDDRWISLERYLYEHADIRFSHGVCPTCYPAVRAAMGLGT